MYKVKYTTKLSSILSDVYTPVGVYLRLRDSFRDSVLLESNAGNDNDNNYSFIGIKAIAGIEMNNSSTIEYRLPNDEAKTVQLSQQQEAFEVIQRFMSCFETETAATFPASVAQGLLGYMSYNAVGMFEKIALQKDDQIPEFRFRFYQFIIAIDHFKNQLYIIENIVPDVDSEINLLETLLQKKDIPHFPFEKIDNEMSNDTEDAFIKNVEKGIEHCQLGDVFQVVLSRSFQQQFQGDDFNVYRQLRSINPSPYLFYFDYGNYRLFGSSPESQLIIKNDIAIVHPIAGTIKRTGDTTIDNAAAEKLINDEKENAEHTMLVDLARNDLSIVCNDVKVNYYKKVKQFSHLMHLVSEVTGTLKTTSSNLIALGKTFPAGTLSGAPKYRAMQIIDTLETTPRGFYAGAIGMLSFQGDCNMAIMIRTFLSKNNFLHYRAGAGIVVKSEPAKELKEVNNKIAALRSAIDTAHKEH